MNTRQIASHALASALSLGLASAASAHQPGGDPPGKERCYGVSPAGQNHCANLAGTHDCAGQAANDRDPGEWQYVPRGSCKKLKGLTVAEATAAHRAAQQATHQATHQATQRAAAKPGAAGPALSTPTPPSRPVPPTAPTPPKPPSPAANGRV